MSKGNVTDIIFIMAFVLVASITIILCYFILNAINVGTPASIDHTYFGYGLQAIGYMDYGIASLFIGMSLFSIISAYYIRTSPIFLIFGILSLAIITFISAYISNISYDLLNSGSIAAVSTNFPITSLILQNLPIEMALVGGLILIALYGKRDGGNAAMY